MLGFTTKVAEDIPEKQKRFDRIWGVFIVFLIACGVALFVLDANYLHVHWVYLIGIAVAAVAVVLNLVKGNIDWRKKKARQKNGEIPTKFSSEEIGKMAEHAEPVKKSHTKPKDFKSFSALDHSQQKPSGIDEEAVLMPLIAISKADPMAVEAAKGSEEDQKPSIGAMLEDIAIRDNLFEKS